ncbi:uridine phosphorylase [Roseiarcus fermentans]|uniref:Uridine phosphorylase n=1 Tax=Roseiarcus fermentans TaxID=1473586 RepID=A0A366F9P4_9HYPH|nr:nucleoside phosphorylase [Roseiarcus fermentans]RBP11383.1 uridine phosphorylase [Roseiarcus fermentans]
MTETAWYIGCAKEDVGESALLTGDRARIDRIAAHLKEPRILAENRGLRTVTGLRGGMRVTATAFGMGGPIAAIVLHELFDLGVRRFIRVGTAMAMPPAGLGDMLLADGALAHDGTSRTYAPAGYPAVADFDLGAALRAALVKRALPWRAGLFGTYDGFYTESFALSAGEAVVIDKVREEVRRLGLIATDMETATLLTAGRVLGARVASLCLGTVDGLSQAKLDADALAAREADMFEIALDALAAG